MECERSLKQKAQHKTYLYTKGHYVAAPTNPIIKKVIRKCTCGRTLSPMYTANYLSKQDHIYCYGCHNSIPLRCRLCLCDRTCDKGHFFCEECIDCKICTTCGECNGPLGLVMQFPKTCCICYHDIPRRCGQCMITHMDFSRDVSNEYCKKCED